MSILIKGMKMPKTCNDCPLHELFFAFGKQNIVCSPTGHALGGIDEKHLKESRNAGYCPLIEIPPHGRLIDADALEYEEAYLNGHYELGDVEIVTRKDIESAPTVIPASKEE